MKAVILAAGYGTRLQRDVDNDTSGRFKHLAGIAKPLLPVGHCALISHWVQALNTTGCVDTVFVITNALHHKAFEEWALDFRNVKVLSDGTKSNEDRLGAVACLQLTVKHFKIEDHVIVIGGDTLFKEEFSLIKVKEKFSELQAMCEDSSLILSYQCKDEETQKYGILEVDEHLRVLCMKEKPLPSETKSRRACPCFYLFSKKILHLLDAFLDENKLFCQRTHQSKKRTHLETFCHGSFQESLCIFIRFLAVLMWETCPPMLNVTGTSEKIFKM
ncbi:uncharacterized protein zgc:136439 isoform X2 [Oncorhynchus tshawytscha]|uniref:Nucleotidyl transferase domain-containing protein n=1 Tax=Oncorhynchus tshawytscha TaxID=74940 RepID=A0A8C8IAS4_ONCTS|nr:uncharacterized protein zgc:136439 isoform X2 [Oncorhynchus tshawytscha]